MLFLLLTFLTAGLALADDGSLPCENLPNANLTADLTKVPWPWKGVAAKRLLDSNQRIIDAKLVCSGMKLEANEDKLAYAVADKTVGQGRTASMDLGTGRVLTDGAAVVDAEKVGFLGGRGNTADAQIGWSLGFLDGQTMASGVRGGGSTVVDATQDAAARQKAEVDRQAAEAAAKEAARQAKIRALEGAGGS